MIFDAILQFMFTVPGIFLSLLEPYTSDMHLPDFDFSYITTILTGIGLFFDVNTLVICFSTVGILTLIYFVLNVIMFIKSWVPTMGGR